MLALIGLYGTHKFVRLNERIALTAEEVKVLLNLRADLIQEPVRLNGKAVLTVEEIEVVRKLREG